MGKLTDFRDRIEAQLCWTEKNQRFKYMLFRKVCFRCRTSFLFWCGLLHFYEAYFRNVQHVKLLIRKHSMVFPNFPDSNVYGLILRIVFWRFLYLFCDNEYFFLDSWPGKLKLMKMYILTGWFQIPPPI